LHVRLIEEILNVVHLFRHFIVLSVDLREVVVDALQSVEVVSRDNYHAKVNAVAHENVT